MDKVEFFNPEASNEAEKIMRVNEYRKHLKRFRVWKIIGFIILAALFYWYGERGRYEYNSAHKVLVDTKTGNIFHGNGIYNKEINN